MTPVKSIIVVGAGPVGLLTGLRCAKAGIPTTVLEMLPEIENSPRAAVYQPVAVQELDRAGVLEDCRKIGTSSTKISWRKINGEPIVEMERKPSKDEPYENLILGQHELAEVIFRHFKNCEASKILFRYRVTDIVQDNNGVVVTAETATGTKELTATYVVGADGGRSTVRQLMGVSFDGFTWSQQIVATNVVYPFDKYGYSTGNQIVHPDHFCVVAKLNESGLWRVSYGETPASDEELRERLPMKYEAIFPGPRPLEYDLKMFSPYRLHQKCASSFRSGRILLAGDAAHLCNPFGGLGLTGGLLDAGALGDALIAVIKDGVSEAILGKYDEIRRGIFQNVIDPTSQANLRRLCETDPDTVRETDPFFRSILQADKTGKEKIRGLGQLRVSLIENET
ncbi:putative monooxygenase [Clohesyomyces aquaticus]|uniref:Putative monooxygenase n=1 Tax=Clohesyomyces aquaticus TaxID=1231657 RepID=A0A1Y1ZHX5_9PLEO|nr:putative monooxygenase [Clohesyomyces aquaticus]